MTKTNLPVVHSGATGRPPYSGTVRGKIIAALKLGVSRSAAAEEAGVHRDTLLEWVKREPDFAQAVLQAEAHAEAQYTRLLRVQAGKGDLQAIRFFLERRRAANWREQVAQVSVDRPIDEIMDEVLSDDVLRDRLDRVARAVLADGAADVPRSGREGTGPPESAD